MKTTSCLIRMLLTLLCLLIFVLLLQQCGLFGFFEKLLRFTGIFLVSLCFVFTFEPLIERIPIGYRSLQCLIVYVLLFVLILTGILLLFPIISDQWDSVVTVFDKLKTMDSSETEMTIQVEKAMTGFLPVLSLLKDGLLSYVLSFFISLEYRTIKHDLLNFPYICCFFQLYDQMKESIFQYIKAMMIDIGLLFVGQCLLLGIFQVQSYVSLALFLALMNIIPYFGSTIALVFIFLVDTLSFGRFRFGMIFCVFALQQIESNCLQPLLYGKMMNVKPLYIVLSILFFGTLFGLFGVIFAPIFAVSIQILLKMK